MVKISNSFTRGRDGDLVNITYNVVGNLKGNSIFPNPPAALEEAEKLLPEYQEALSNATGRDRKLVSIKNDKRDKLRALLMIVAGYVTEICKGDKTMLLSSGFNITGERGGKTLSPINDVEVDARAPGQAIIRIKKVTGARAFLYQYSKEQPTSEDVWLSVGSSDREHTLTGLQSGVKYWFRVVAIGFRKQVVHSPVVSWFIQ